MGPEKTVFVFQGRVFSITLLGTMREGHGATSCSGNWTCVHPATSGISLAVVQTAVPEYKLNYSFSFC